MCAKKKVWSIFNQAESVNNKTEKKKKKKKERFMLPLF